MAVVSPSPFQPLQPQQYQPHMECPQHQQHQHHQHHHQQQQLLGGMDSWPVSSAEGGSVPTLPPPFPYPLSADSSDAAASAAAAAAAMAGCPGGFDMSNSNFNSMLDSCTLPGIGGMGMGFGGAPMMGMPPGDPVCFLL